MEAASRLGLMAEAALELARLGPVFPCRDKRPLTERGYKDATTDPGQIAEWWGAWPDANVGLATGEVIVLDVDGPEGEQTLAALELEGGPLPPTLEARTGRGRHLYYRSPQGAVIGNAAGERGRGLGKGLDVRGRGGYVIAPPSRHAETGKAYEWANPRVPVAPLPEWVAVRLEKPKAPAPVVPLRPSPNGQVSDREQAYGKAALEAEAQAVRTAAQGERNHALNRAAFSLGQLVASGQLAEGEVLAELEAAAQAAGLEAGETRLTLRSGLEAGKAQPRSVELERRPAAEVVTTGPPKRAGLPQVVCGDRPLPEITDEALSALRQANAVRPEVFLRDCAPAQVIHSADGRGRIKVLDENALRGRLARVAQWVKPAKGGAYRDVFPPLDVVRDVRAQVAGLDLGRNGIPELEGVIEGPVVRPNGKPLTEPGYDPETHLYYSPGAALGALEVPEYPTAEDAQAALEVLLEPLREFCFVSEADRTNALAYVLTPIVRPMVEGIVPLALLTAPTEGTGKGLLANVAAIIATGNEAEVTPCPPDERELEKTLKGVLLEGASSVVLDEARVLSGGFLNSVLTAQTLRIRTLGLSDSVRCENRATYAALGNNVSLRGDTRRRFYPIRLDPKTSEAFTRQFERNEDELKAYCRENRAELLTAALTMARAWVVARRPGKPHRRLGGFSAWTRVLGGILAYAGREDFLDNLASAQAQANGEAIAFEGFLLELERVFPEGKPFRVADVAKAVGGDEGLRSSLLEDFDPEDRRLGVKLGKRFDSQRDKRHGERGLRVEQAGRDNHSKANLWRVVADEPAE